MSSKMLCKENESINKDLDKLSIAILNTLKSIVNERQYLDANLKEGYINMAKSRYLMRGQKISILQVNINNLVSTSKVSSYLDVDENIRFLTYIPFEDSLLREDAKDLKFRSNRTEDKLADTLKHTSLDEEDSDRRETSDNSKNFIAPNSVDPLKWFGVLVPESLRTCQSHFKQSVATALKVASLQNKLIALGQEYKLLRKKKIVSLEE